MGMSRLEIARRIAQLPPGPRAEALEAFGVVYGQKPKAVAPTQVTAPQSMRDTAPVFEPLRAPARYKGAHGGRGSGKSHFFAQYLVERCMQRTTRAVCVREVQKSLQQSVKRLLEDKIQQFGLGSAFRVLNTHIEAPNGGMVIFAGMQNHTAESMKSLEGYDIAWVEEAQTLSQRSLDLLRPTIRKDDSELWFSWNPSQPTDPVDVLLRNGPPPGAAVVQATYRDNPWLPDVLRQEMEWDRSRDPEKYAHIWGGKYEQHSEARVFKNWRVEDFATPTQPVPTFLLGGDWGFAVDPTVLVRCYIVGRTLYVDFEVYRVGCEIDHTPALFDSLGCLKCAAGPCDGHQAPGLGHGTARFWTITADSARPETISYMQRHGYPRVQPARKGPGSVEEGVEFLKNYDIVVHPRCTHTIDELTNYRYKTDPLTNQVLPVLDDTKNHVIDSLRYAVEPLRRGPQPVRMRPAVWG